jgi:hypothetical protein
MQKYSIDRQTRGYKYAQKTVNTATHRRALRVDKKRARQQAKREINDGC